MMEPTDVNQPLTFKIGPIDETREIENDLQSMQIAVNSELLQDNGNHHQMLEHMTPTKSDDLMETNDNEDNINRRKEGTIKACYYCYKQTVDKCTNENCLHYCCEDHMRFASEAHFILFCKYDENEVFCEKCGKEYKQLSLTCSCIIMGLLIVSIILAIVYL